MFVRWMIIAVFMFSTESWALPNGAVLTYTPGDHQYQRVTCNKNVSKFKPIIRKNWDDGYNILDSGIINGEWCFLFSKSNKNISQFYRYFEIDKLPFEYLNDKTKDGYSIRDVTIGNDIVFMLLEKGGLFGRNILIDHDTIEPIGTRNMYRNVRINGRGMIRPGFTSWVTTGPYSKVYNKTRAYFPSDLFKKIRSKKRIILDLKKTGKNWRITYGKLATQQASIPHQTWVQWSDNETRQKRKSQGYSMIALY